MAPCLTPQLFMLQLSPSWVPGLPVRPFPSVLQTLPRAGGLEEQDHVEGEGSAADLSGLWFLLRPALRERPWCLEGA